VTRRSRLALQFAGWLAATALLVFCLREVNGREVRDALRLMRWQWIALALVANALILVSWTGLWWIVAPREERPKYSTMFEINSIASALMNTVPFLGGHAAALVLLVKRGRMTHHGALSVMALDQLGEGMAKLAIFAVVAAGAPIPDWMRAGIGTACVAVALLLVALLLAAHGHVHILGSAGQSGIIARVRRFTAAWASRLEALRSARQSAVALAFAIGTKVAEGAGILAVQHAFGVNLSIGATALVLAAVVLGSMVPVAPGNVGTYEAAAFLAYRHLGIEPGTATMLAIAGHLCFLISSIGIGYIAGSVKHLRWGPTSPPAHQPTNPPVL
jgi:glycosyltransferase 2 family protein